jgi:hypothetical protein
VHEDDEILVSYSKYMKKSLAVMLWRSASSGGGT